MGFNLALNLYLGLTNERVFLLDQYPTATAAYSLRKLRNLYTGSAIRVRRDSDNSEQDISFNFNGQLNTTALENFCQSSYESDWDITGSDWTKANVTINSSQSDSEGGSTAFKVIPNSATTFHIAQVSTSDITSGRTYKTTYRLKASGRNFIQIETLVVGEYVNVNLSTGAFASDNFSGTKTIEDLGGGWYEVSLIETATSTSFFTSLIAIDAGTDTNRPNVAGNGIDGTLVDNINVDEVSNGFVATWYDQSGNSNHAIQTTLADQPKIYDASNGVVLDSGKPAIDFANDFLSVPYNANLQTASFSHLIVATPATVGDNWRGLYNGRSTANPGAGTAATDVFGYNVYINNTTGRWSFWSGTGVDGTWTTHTSLGPAVVGQTDLVSMHRDDTSGDGTLYVNSIEQHSVNSIYAPSTTMGVDIGQLGSFRYSGTISEFLIYGSDQSANRFGIEEDINNYYGIY